MKNSGRGGKRLNSGRKRQWNDNDLITVKIPRSVKNQVIEYAKQLDGGVSSNQSLIEKSKQILNNNDVCRNKDKWLMRKAFYLLFNLPKNYYAKNKNNN